MLHSDSIATIDFPKELINITAGGVGSRDREGRDLHAVKINRLTHYLITRDSLLLKALCVCVCVNGSYT